MSDVRALANRMARQEVSRVVNLKDMLGDDDFRIGFDRLVEQIRTQRQAELDEAADATHPEILQEFAAEAGFLIGLAIGSRLPDLKGRC